MKRFWDIDYRELAKKIDVISWDSYPAFHNDKETYADTMIESAFDHAIMRGLKKYKPFMLMESAPGQVNWMEYNKLKRPGVHKQFAVQAFGRYTNYPKDSNKIKSTISSLDWDVKDYAEILRVTDAEVLGSYVDDFYKDTPAITIKNTGLGSAYYQAARMDNASIKDFLEAVLKDIGIAYKELPYGVEKHTRYSDNYSYEFYLNTSENIAQIDDIYGEDVINGNNIEGVISINPKELFVIKKRISM